MELLDEIKNKKNSRRTFSILSLILGLTTFLLLGYLLAQMPDTITVKNEVQQPSRILISGIRISCILGLVMAILSFTNKEKSGAIKWAGATLNVISFIAIFGSILFMIWMKIGQ